MFDLEKTAELERLFAIPREERNDTWREAFFAAVPDASLATFAEQVAYGPDGNPYFRLAVPEPGPFETFCLRHVLDGCLENGVGVVVLSRDGEAEWVFAYGDLWGFKESGRFPAGGPPAVVTERRPATVGPPNEAMLPAYARRVLRRVFEEDGVTDAEVWLVHAPGLDPERSFAFRPAPSRGLLWYVRRDLGVLTAQEGWGPGLPL